MRYGKLWSEGKTVEQKILYRDSREAVYLSNCSVCNRPNVRAKERKELRFFDDIGIICEECFAKAKKCTVKGCCRPGLPAEGGICRVHFMGEEVIHKRSLLGNHAAHSEIYGCEKRVGVYLSYRNGYSWKGIVEKLERTKEAKK